MKNYNELCPEIKNIMNTYPNNIKNLSYSEGIKIRSSVNIFSHKRIFRKLRSGQYQEIKSEGKSVLACVVFGISVLFLGMSVFWKQSTESELLAAASILSAIFCMTLCFSHQNKS
ncbi:MAG: hypothetical protein IPN79_15760 [Saprospiraceae bacterium]|nr:hypothetical protein [Saprospiraceae bacterium]